MRGLTIASLTLNTLTALFVLLTVFAFMKAGSGSGEDGLAWLIAIEGLAMMDLVSITLSVITSVLVCINVLNHY